MKGVSPLIAMVLVIAFGFAAMAIVVMIINPLLDRARDSGTVNEATQNMQLIDSAIKAVASEAQGSKRTIGMKITDGELRTDPGQDSVYIEFEPKSDTQLNGFSGDVRLESKPNFLEYFNEYSDGNNANDTWTLVNGGSWSINQGRLLGSGAVYHSLGTLGGFELEGYIVSSVTPNGQIYTIPGNLSDLVLYITFDSNDNSSVNTTYDFSAYRNNGTLANSTSAACFTNNACPDWALGKFGNATAYDGIGDYTNVTNSTTLNITGSSITVSSWINVNGTGASGSLNNRRIISKANSSNVQYDLSIDPSRLIVWRVQASSDTSVSSSAISLNTWTSIVGTYDGSNIKLYVNGEQVNSTSLSGNIQGMPDGLKIGKYSDGPNGIFNGTIDEVMMFNRSLTASEVKYLYDSSIKKITTGDISQSIAAGANVTLVLSSPGSTYFDNIKIKTGQPKLRFVVPYQKIDISNQVKFGPGDHSIVIENMGLNSTTNRPRIQVTSG